MRLLNTSTYRLESFLGTSKPPYAILSHTWEPDGEILFSDLQLLPTQWSSKAGFSKVKNTCTRAFQDGYEYVWLDTCCIDKSSSAELSEAINSMFRWYKQSSVCYAFLTDVDLESSMSSSRWFTRGWTLQELIAPDEVLFYDMHWRFLGSRGDLASVITSATQIPNHVLDRPRQTVEDALQSASVAQRMNWASERVTTREEDIAYCLMGIFDVNMPLLYGEGQKAFFRLQETILYATKDHTILAFRHPEPPSRKQICNDGFSAVLASEPGYFCDDIRREKHGSITSAPVKLEYGNITLEVYLVPITRTSDLLSSAYSPTHVALLDAVCGEDYLSRPGLLVQAVGDRDAHFKRCASKAVIVKSTLESSWIMHVIGSHNIAETYDCTRENWREAKKISITIESNRPDAVQARYNSYQPIVLSYAVMLDHCWLRCAHPKPSNKYHEIYLWKSIGIVLFAYMELTLIVAWGDGEEPWCSVHSFESLMSHSNFRNKFPGLLHNFTADEIMEELLQLPEQYLIETFKDEPFLWSWPFTVQTTRPSISTVVDDTLIITGRWTYKEFVGRKYRYLEIFAGLQQPHQTSTNPKFWFWKD